MHRAWHARRVHDPRRQRRRRTGSGRPAGRALGRLARRVTLAGVLVLLLAAAGTLTPRRWLAVSSGAGPDVAAPADLLATVAAAATPTPTPARKPAAAAGAQAAASASPQAAGLTAADRGAGLLSDRIPDRGTGRLVVVPGSVAAPGSGTLKRVKVEVEGGLDVDASAFAGFVMDTLNDPRSWGHGGRMTFARTTGSADITVVLASPRTSITLCAPLQTMGTLSCGVGSTAVLTLYRWVKAVPDYGSDRTGYRHYLVNHEVGHTLGHGHLQCAGRGAVAPVMMQQTKGLQGCLPNPWPYP